MSDFVKIFSAAGVEYRLAPHPRVRKNWIGVDCPVCSPGHRKFRLGFELSTGRCHCWMCGGAHSASMLSAILKKSKGEVIGLLRSLRYRFAEEEVQYTNLELKRPDGVGTLQAAHIAYVQKRRFDPDYLTSTWGVGGIGGHVRRLKWSLYIPVYDRFGKEVSWTTRAIGNTERRYYSASPEEEIVSHKQLLYGAHLARHTIVIVEGPIDAWAIGPGAVATCGVGYSDAQLSEMSKYPIRAVCFDNEPDAQARAEALCRELAIYPGITDMVTLESGKDAAECDKAEIEKLRQLYFPEYSLELV